MAATQSPVNVEVNLPVLLSCVTCGLNFNSMTDLDHHLDSHHGSKHKCRKSQSFTSHIHKTPKLECLTCRQGFCNFPELQQHLGEHSKGEFKCEICEQVFLNSDDFGGHMMAAHAKC